MMTANRIRNRRLGGRTVRASRPRRREYLPGQLLIRIREQAVRPHVAAGRLRLSAVEAKLLPETVSEPIDHLRRNAGLKAVEPLFSTRRVSLARAEVAAPARARLAVLSSVTDSESEELAGITLVTIDPKKATPALIKHLQASRAIAFAERVPARWLAARATADPLLNRQWSLRAIRWFEANRPDARSVMIGVLDTGIDTKHPDLAAVPIAYHHPGLLAQDLLGHGTHVAGIIAAGANNSVGIAGVATCKLGVWKIFRDEPDPEDGEFYVDGVQYLRALNSVIGAGVKVVNLSIGGTASSQTEALLFRRLQDRGVVVVAAMGNEYEEGNPTEYPAAYDGVISVGAVAETGRRASFSNTGRHIDLVAPGEHILSTVPMKTSPYLEDTEYAAWDGTSMATPHVSAAVALIVARGAGQTVSQTRNRLRRTATRLPGMRGRAWTSAYGSGLLNLMRALD